MVEFYFLFLDCEEEMLSRLDQHNVNVVFGFEVENGAGFCHVEISVVKDGDLPFLGKAHKLILWQVDYPQQIDHRGRSYSLA